MKRNKASQNRFPVFSKRFNELRGKRSQEEFADFLGISRPTVGFYENGTRLPDALVLRQIAERCNVSADWLLDLSNEKPFNCETNQVCNYLGLSKEAVQALVELRNSPSECRATIADYILAQSSFLEQLIEYLTVSVFSAVEDPHLGNLPPSKEEIGDVPKELATFMYSTPIMAPDEDIGESFIFAKIIKNLPRLYDSFKEAFIGNKDFVAAVVDDYVDSFKVEEEGYIRIPRRQTKRKK